jgi:hypothetical protein
MTKSSVRPQTVQSKEVFNLTGFTVCWMKLEVHLYMIIP